MWLIRWLRHQFLAEWTVAPCGCRFLERAFLPLECERCEKHEKEERERPPEQHRVGSDFEMIYNAGCY